MSPAGSAGASAPARITTTLTARRRHDPREQRRSFGPGEDHNMIAATTMPVMCWQRRSFGPGEDHNLSIAAGGPGEYRAAPELRPRRGSQLQPRHDYPRDPQRSAGASAPARITTLTTGWSHRTCTPQRRSFGPGEDHNMKASFEYPPEQGAAPELRPRRGSQLQRLYRGDRRTPGSAGASAPARITTSSRTCSATRSPCSAGASAPARITTTAAARSSRGAAGQRRSFGPGEDHNSHC